MTTAIALLILILSSARFGYCLDSVFTGWPHLCAYGLIAVGALGIIYLQIGWA